MTSPDAAVVAALGEPEVLAGYELAGARLHAARTPVEARLAWAHLPEDTAVVLLTPPCAAALAGLLDDPDRPLTITLPS